jgi:6-phospho-3-hexuloisomerase
MVRQSGDPVKVTSQRPRGSEDSEEFALALDDVLAEATVLLAGADTAAAVQFMAELRKAKRIYVLGAGRSRLVAEAFAMRLMHLGFKAHVASEVTSPAIRDAGDLLVACSGSGETPTVVQLARTARQTGARVIVVTATRGSTLAGTAQLLIHLPERSRDGELDQSIQFVGTLFEQGALLYLDAIVLTLERLLQADREQMLARHTNLE